MGQYIWNQWPRTTPSGEAIFVVSDDIAEYPINGAQDGHYYRIVKKDLDATSWAKIKEVADSGLADKLFSVGDEKAVTLTSGEQIVVQIAGFGKDTYTAGGTAPITFVMRDCLNTTRQMNSSDTNAGGWQNSAMRTYCNGTLLNLFPAELKNLIKQVNKKGYNGTTTTIQTTADYLWLLAEVEIFGSKTYAAGTAEGNLYPIFTDNASRIKKVNGSAYWWWERSPYASYSSGFCHVYSGGTAYNYGLASLSGGVAVGFCI